MAYAKTCHSNIPNFTIYTREEERDILEMRREERDPSPELKKKKRREKTTAARREKETR